MTDSDILADLAAKPRRPSGTPCRISYMRRDRPDLLPQWERVLAAKRAGEINHSSDVIAQWFNDHNFRMSRNVPERHIRVDCEWCASGLSA